jgi:hypothetical protein
LDVIVYVETNFLMSVAMGREARGDDLFAAVPPSLRIAILSGCYMESFSAFEDERRRRNSFRSQLETQIGQLRRDTTSAHAGALLRRLEESRIANDELLNDVQTRLFQVVDRAAGILEPIHETPATIHNAVTSMLISDPTDNLILHSILDQASRFPDATKALLTDNTRDFDTPEVLAALAAAGIAKRCRTVAQLLGWIGSLQ